MSAAALERPALVAVEPPTPKRKLPFAPRTAVMVGLALVVGGGGSALIAAPKAAVSTEAAYLQADSTVVAPRVRGLVAEVLAADNQVVRKGDPLVTIDPEEFDARIAQAGAELKDAQATVAAAQAALVALGAEEQLAASNVRAVSASISSAEAQAVVAEADRARYDALLASGFVPRREADRVRAVAVTAASDAERRRVELDVSRNQAALISAKRASLTANLAQAEAAVARAEASLNLARQDRDHTIIRAPIDGVVGDRKIEPGGYVQPGTRLLTVVPMNALYLTANFKETQTARMRVGQPVSIKVDALPGVTLSGEVESFAPGSGSQFSLLPFEPGTGNFTKIVQRVPVRIRLTPGQAEVARLRPGLSATAKVRLSD